jgi:hypothetical protein
MYSAYDVQTCCVNPVASSALRIAAGRVVTDGQNARDILGRNDLNVKRQFWRPNQQGKCKERGCEVRFRKKKVQQCTWR